LSDIQCALGISQLKKLDIFLKRRREIAKIYNNFFAKLDYIKIQKLGPNVLHAYHLYNIKFNFLKKKIKKNKIIKLFRDNNINLQTHYFPVHLQPYYKKNFKFKKNDFPESEKHYNCSFSLPIYFRLKNKDIKKITDIFKKI